ncbi:hypothetical protein BDY24DRAFT_402832 [Mrakia frigida]|uniref:uncharacterized protein n=1 Tax=Mrakia frigida TaxID=29902 RepID=UPI003FCBF581
MFEPFSISTSLLDVLRLTTLLLRLVLTSQPSQPLHPSLPSVFNRHFHLRRSTRRQLPFSHPSPLSRSFPSRHP